LDQLQLLDVSGNSFTEDLDLSIFSNHSKLTTLNFSKNSFQRLVFSSTPETFDTIVTPFHFETLNVSSNFLTTISPMLGVSGAQILKTLALNENLLKEIPSEFGLFEAIEYLDLSTNPELVIPPVILNLNSLTTLKIGRTADMPSVPQNIANLTRLELLDLEKMGVKSFPMVILQLTTLKILVLSQNEPLPLPEEFDQLENLEEFYCSRCDPGSPRAGRVSVNLPKLKILEIENNDIQSFNVTGLPNLKSLAIQTREFTPNSLEGTSLETVLIGGDYLQSIPEFPPSLKTILIVKINASSWPTSFTERGFPLLTSLSVVNNPSYSGEPLNFLPFPEFFFTSQMDKKTLNMMGNINGMLPSSFPNTSLISISGTQIKGTLSPSLFQSEQLQTLELSSNPFISGPIPDEIATTTSLKRLILSNNNFEPVLNKQLETLNPPFCTLSQEGEKMFTCESERLLGQQQICNVKCASPFNLQGVWLNEDEECPVGRFNLGWNVGKIEIFENGTASTVLPLFKKDCPSPALGSFKLDGTLSISDHIWISQHEVIMNVTFVLAEQSIVASTDVSRSWFSHFCNYDVEIGVWKDVTLEACDIPYALGVVMEIFDLSKCPQRFDRWYINFKNSTLKSAGGVFLGVSSSSDCNHPNTSLDIIDSKNWRRDWECTDSREPSSCSPKCGDGFVFGNETCDDHASRNGDGCNVQCQIERGWECVVSNETFFESSCSPICDDGIIVNKTGDCDSDKKSSKSDGSSGGLFLILLMLLLVPMIAGIQYWFVKRKSNKLMIDVAQLKMVAVIGEGNFGKVTSL